jgi:hypothetical protein
MPCAGGCGGGAAAALAVRANNVGGAGNAGRNRGGNGIEVTLPAILARERQAQQAAFNLANPVLAQQAAAAGGVGCNLNAAQQVAARAALQPLCSPGNAAQQRQLEVIAARRAALIGDRLTTSCLNSIQSVAVEAQIALERDAILAARAGSGNILRPGRRCGAIPQNGTCLPIVDANILALQEQAAMPCCRARCERVCRAPSMFRALTPQGAVEQSFNAGMISELPSPDSFAARGSRGSASLPGAGVGLRFGNLSVQAQNILQQPRTFCRAPSVFGCLSQTCASAACLQMGVTNNLPEIGISRIDARANASLGGPLLSTVGNSICVPATRFGNEI